MRFIGTLTLVVMASACGYQALAQTPPPPSSAPIPKGHYTLDKAHSSLIFRVNHLGFSRFTGRFTGIDATLAFDPNRLNASSVSVSIDPRSIATDNAPEGFLDTLAKDKDWLNAAEFPQMTFVSQRVEVVSGKNLRVHGALTLRGITRPLVLETRYNGGYASHPFEPSARIGFSAQGSFKRSDYGIAAGVPASGSQFGVGDEIQVTLEAEFKGPPLEVAKP